MSDIIPGTKEYIPLNQVPDSSSPMIPIPKDSKIPNEMTPTRPPESPWLPDEADGNNDFKVVDEIDQMLKARSESLKANSEDMAEPQPKVVPQVRPRTGVDTTPAFTPEGLLDPQKSTAWWKKLLRK